MVMNAIHELMRIPFEQQMPEIDLIRSSRRKEAEESSKLQVPSSKKAPDPKSQVGLFGPWSLELFRDGEPNQSGSSLRRLLPVEIVATPRFENICAAFR
jgi:hypothetical protein